MTTGHTTRDTPHVQPRDITRPTRRLTSAEVATGTTQRLYLSASPASLPVRVEFLELCRLEEDEIQVTCGEADEATMRARVVQG